MKLAANIVRSCGYRPQTHAVIQATTTLFALGYGLLSCCSIVWTHFFSSSFSRHDSDLKLTGGERKRETERETERGLSASGREPVGPEAPEVDGWSVATRSGSYVSRTQARSGDVQGRF